jgi:hypothetical protein
MEGRSVEALTAVEREFRAGEWAVRAGEWAVRAGERAVRAGEWAVRAGERAVRAGERAVRAGEWAVRAGEWAVRAGEWAVRAGEWAVRAGEREVRAVEPEGLPVEAEGESVEQARIGRVPRSAASAEPVEHCRDAVEELLAALHITRAHVLPGDCDAQSGANFCVGACGGGEAGRSVAAIGAASLADVERDRAESAADLLAEIAIVLPDADHDGAKRLDGGDGEIEDLESGGGWRGGVHAPLSRNKHDARGWCAWDDEEGGGLVSRPACTPPRHPNPIPCPCPCPCP